MSTKCKARKRGARRIELAPQLGLFGKLGLKMNQLAQGLNRSGEFPGIVELITIRREVAQMRAAVTKALGRGH